MTSQLERLDEVFVSREYYLKWINTFIETDNDHDLVLMLKCFINSQGFKKISKLWLKLLCLHLQRYRDFGFDEFKGHIARHYSLQSWQHNNQYISDLISAVGDETVDQSYRTLFQRHAAFSFEDSIHYNISTLMLYELVRKYDSTGFLEMLEEPEIGSPPAIHLDKRIS
jgi:hypothetical protein